MLCDLCPDDQAWLNQGFVSGRSKTVGFASGHLEKVILPKLDRYFNDLRAFLSGENVLLVARDLGVDQESWAVEMRNSEGFEYSVYIEGLLSHILDGIPYVDSILDQGEDLNYFYISGVGLNQFTWDDIDEVLDGGMDVSTLIAFCVWVESVTDDAGAFYKARDHYDWPFEQYVQVDKDRYPKQATVERRLKKMGFENLIPIIRWAFYPPDNAFFNCSFEDDTVSEEFSAENILLLREEFSKIAPLLDGFDLAHQFVVSRPKAIGILAEAMELRYADGRRYRADLAEV